MDDRNRNGWEEENMNMNGNDQEEASMGDDHIKEEDNDYGDNDDDHPDANANANANADAAIKDEQEQDHEDNDNDNDNDHDDNEDNEEDPDDDNDDGEDPDDDNGDDDNDNDDNDVIDGPDHGEENDAIEGGVANGGEGGNQHSSSCNMHVYIECTEIFPPSLVPTPNHPIYSPGIKVVIGLEKTTRLSAVFQRYCEFANSYQTSNPVGIYIAPLHVETSELEFSHCSILQSSDTAETSALMKTDTIHVRRARIKERRMDYDWARAKRSSDQLYFEQLKNMMPDKMPVWMMENNYSGAGGGVVVFCCSGRIRDERGYRQNVLMSNVKGNERVLGKRCQWLREKIETARREYRANIMRDREMEMREREIREREMVRDRGEDGDEDMLFEAQQRQVGHGNGNGNNNGNNINIIVRNGNGNAVPVDDDGVVNVNNVNGNMDMDMGNDANVVRANVNAVEDDEEEDHGNGNGNGNDNNDNPRRMNVNMGIHNIQEESADESDKEGDDDVNGNRNGNGNGNGNNPNAVPMDGANDAQRRRQRSNPTQPVQVVLDHPPEAVKLLLEYCYTNRVIALGQKAFNKSYKPVDPNSVDPLLADLCGPVSPFSGPKGGRPSWGDGDTTKKPTVSLSVALAGIQLAEEANMPRLSLMCEIAASEMVTDHSALEALALCEQQSRLSGNRLAHLRKSVMLYHVLGCGKKGVEKLSNMSSFKRTLREKSDDVVPSLMMGVMEAVKSVRGEKDDPNEDLAIRTGRKAHTNMKFKQMDEDDTLERGKERLKRRKERWNKRIRYDDEKNPYRLEPIEDTLILVEMERFLHEDGSLLPKATDRFASRFRTRSSGRTSSRKRRR